MPGSVTFWVTLAVLASVALLARSLIRARARLRAARERQEWHSSREADREAARAVLARPREEWPFLERLPEGFPQRPAYFAARCTLLAERPEGDGFTSRGQGWLVICPDRLCYHAEAGEASSFAIAMEAIERVDSPYVNVLEVIEQDPETRVWTSHFFRLHRPLVAAAYLSRLAGFELIL
ncbi:MAG: hypothetical protein DIU69_09915 [Bacillota bacterium]|nr:MAG: hypothetical protein DIU69_09915 [Bacillota bacterium]